MPVKRRGGCLKFKSSWNYLVNKPEMKENQKLCVEKDFQKYYRKILVDNPLSQYSSNLGDGWVPKMLFKEWVFLWPPTCNSHTTGLIMRKSSKEYHWRARENHQTLSSHQYLYQIQPPQDFLRGRLPKLKRNAPMFLLVSHRVPGVPQWVPFTTEWLPIDLRVSAGPMLVSKLRSPICVHRCPPVAAIGVHGVPPASAVARHCAVVTSIRRNIHIFGVHLCNIGPYTRVIYSTLQSITCRVLCQLASIEDAWV